MHLANYQSVIQPYNQHWLTLPNQKPLIMRGIKKVIVVAVAAASLFLTVNNDDDADDC